MSENGEEKQPEETQAEETPVEETPVEETPAAEAEEAPVEETPAEEPVAEEPAADEPVAEEPVAEEPAADEPVAEEPVAVCASTQSSSSPSSRSNSASIVPVVAFMSFLRTRWSGRMSGVPGIYTSIVVQEKPSHGVRAVLTPRETASTASATVAETTSSWPSPASVTTRRPHASITTTQA